MRTGPFQLPSYNELLAILKNEASRPILVEKENIHYANFSAIIALLKKYNISSTFFEEISKFEDYKDEGLFNQIISMFTELEYNILKTQDDPEKQKLFNNLYDYLSEQDIPQKSDLIFVFGSKSTFRIEKAVELYKQGYAPKICISGRGPFYEKNSGEVSEAEKLSKYAIEQGVPEKDLILEKESITVPDNVKRSLNLLEGENIPHKTIILVNSPFSQRRG